MKNEKMSEAQKAHWNSPEGLKRRQFSKEHGERISEGKKKFAYVPFATCAFEGCNNQVSSRRAKFCSHSCNSKNNQKNNPTLLRAGGEDSLNWIDGRSSIPDRSMAEVKKKANHTCQACGKYYKNIDVHHLIPQRCSDDIVENNKTENLVVLCRGCHQASERAFINEVSIRAFRLEKEYMDELLQDQPNYVKLVDEFMAWVAVKPTK